MARKVVALAAAAAVVISLANAQSISKNCALNDICYSLNIPNEVFLSGGGELFFQISGRATYSWIGLGQGSVMAGANMFVIYADGMGNVTLSPRLGHGNVQPEYNEDAEVELLAGSGVSNGRMIANVKCSNCNEWEGGSMDLRSDTTDWIGAALAGPSLDSMDLEEDLEQHSVHAAFPWSMVDARGGDSSNPFYTPQTRPTAELAGVGTPMAIAHGVLAALAFLVIFPSGAIFVRFAKFPGLVKIHAAVQIVGYLVYVAAAGLGIHMLLTYPPKYRRYEIYSDPHPKVGMALLVYLFFQPISGWINDRLFGKRGKRLFSHYIHIWAGRLAILLGFVNGGLGLRLGRVEAVGARIGYGIVATLMGILFVANIVFAEFHRDAPNPSELSRRIKGEREVGGGQGHVRMESMEDGERLRAQSGDRSD